MAYSEAVATRRQIRKALTGTKDRDPDWFPPILRSHPMSEAVLLLDPALAKENSLSDATCQSDNDEYYYEHAEDDLLSDGWQTVNDEGYDYFDDREEEGYVVTCADSRSEDDDEYHSRLIKLKDEYTQNIAKLQKNVAEENADPEDILDLDHYRYCVSGIIRILVDLEQKNPSLCPTPVITPSASRDDDTPQDMDERHADAESDGEYDQLKWGDKFITNDAFGDCIETGLPSRRRTRGTTCVLPQGQRTRPRIVTRRQPSPPPSSEERQSPKGGKRRTPPSSEQRQPPPPPKGGKRRTLPSSEQRQPPPPPKGDKPRTRGSKPRPPPPRPARTSKPPPPPAAPKPIA